MGGLNFNTRQCLQALNKLGFSMANRRHGRHDKFIPPAEIAGQLTGLQSRFIMVPRHGDLHCQAEIIRELKAMGGEKLVQEFRKYL